MRESATSGAPRIARTAYSGAMTGSPSTGTEIARADPRRRRLVGVVLASASIVAVAFLVAMHRWMASRASALPTDQLVVELRSWIAILLTAIGLCLLLLAAHAARSARRIAEQRRWPLAGARVLRDTPVRHGADALRLARWLNAAALVLTLLAIGAGAAGWRLFAPLQ